MLKIRGMVDQGRRILEGAADLDEFGCLLDEAWTCKKSLSDGIASSQVEEVYKTAKAHGALGGKLLGAGGTGFMLFYVPPSRITQVRKALSHYVQGPFKFESQGSKIIYKEMI